MNGVGLDHRISPHFLNAGVGFGGSCFPKDVKCLINIAETNGEEPLLLKSVIKVNDLQPLKLVNLLCQRLNTLQNKRVAILGLAFKDNTDDIRESRAIPVIRELQKRGADIAAYDPVANAFMKNKIPEIEYCSSAADALRDADAALILTEWPEFHYLENEFDLMKSKIIIEGRRILSYGNKEGICW
jgi:UDPglucose 6-dehydrogenase